MTDTRFDLQPGDTVTGTYFGQPFVGICTGHRGHTLNWDVLLVTVRLTEDLIRPCGVEPSGGSVQIAIGYDGQPVDGWGACSLEVVR